MALISYLPKKNIPVIRVNEPNLLLVSGYVSGLDLGNLNTTGTAATEQTPAIPGSALTRQQWLDKFYIIRSAYPVTVSRIQAASEELVDLDDLAFMWDLIVNLKAYYDNDEDLYFTINKNSAFQLETMEFVIQGYSPADAMARALDSIRTEVFSSREAMLVKINQMSEAHKKELRDAAAKLDQAGDGGSSGGGYSTGSGTVAQKDTNNRWLLLIVVLIVIIANRKRK